MTELCSLSGVYCTLECDRVDVGYNLVQMKSVSKVTVQAHVLALVLAISVLCESVL